MTIYVCATGPKPKNQEVFKNIPTIFHSLVFLYTGRALKPLLSRCNKCATQIKRVQADDHILRARHTLFFTLRSQPSYLYHLQFGIIKICRVCPRFKQREKSKRKRDSRLLFFCKFQLNNTFMIMISNNYKRFKHQSTPNQGENK